MRIESLAHVVWSHEATTHAQIKIIFVDDRYMRNLNQKFLAKNRATDVLAFPLSETDGETFEGEIYISLDRTRRNAKEYEVDFEQEIRRNVVHGLLHFLGYEDQTEPGREAMRRREDYYLESWNRIPI